MPPFVYKQKTAFFIKLNLLLRFGNKPCAFNGIGNTHTQGFIYFNGYLRIKRDYHNTVFLILKKQREKNRIAFAFKLKLADSAFSRFKPAVFGSRVSYISCRQDLSSFHRC